MDKTLFIESLSRLFNEQKVNVNILNQLLSNQRITNDDYDFIIKKGSEKCTQS